MPDQRTYFGTSLGGLFGTYVLFTAPELFSNYIIGSPSFWYDDGIMFQFEKRFTEDHADLSARVFYAVGELEETEKDPKTLERRMITKYEETILSSGLHCVLDRPPAPEWA
jgi:predicted alpha/beta superfamily hydrolase